MGVSINSLISERNAIVASALPTSTTTGGGTLTTGAVNIAATSGNFFGRYFGVAMINSSNKATATLIKGSDSAVTLATVIASQTIGSTTNYVALFDLNGATEYLNDTANTYIALRIAATVNSAVPGFSGCIVGADGRYDPAYSWNASTVISPIVSV